MIKLMSLRDRKKYAEQKAVFSALTPGERWLWSRGIRVNNVKPGDYLSNATSEERKNMPICTGVLDYFPDALAAVAEHSKVGNDKHNPGEPLHWAREKSTDQADCILRHLAARGTRDKDGTRHSAGLAWRALALLQLEIEAETKK